MWSKLQEIPILKKGGIHIKQKNRGKFTESANRVGMGVQEFANHVLANKDKYSPTLVKRANFARNAKKFKHENGGILKAQQGTGNLFSIKPGSPLDQAWQTANEKLKYPGVKQIVGPDGNKVAIRTEEPLKPVYISEYLPGTGDVAEVGYIANDVKNGNYGSAVLATAMVALPGNVGKIFRKSDVPASKLTEAERLGIPKGERSNPKALDNPQYWGYEQWNERYNAAVRAGNWKEVQRLRDLHFKRNAPNTKVVDENGMPRHMYHGEESRNFKGKPYRYTTYEGVNWDLEDLVEEGATQNHWRLSKPNRERMGNYHTPNYRTALMYAWKDPTLVHDDYLNITNPFTWDGEEIHQILLKAGLRSEKVLSKKTGHFKRRPMIDINGNFIKNQYGDIEFEESEWIPDKFYFRYPYVSDWSDFYGSSKEELMKLGYDGLYIPQYYDSYGAFVSPSQFKSADPITWDGKGEIIPIVKRDNFRNLDTRYQNGGKL